MTPVEFLQHFDPDGRHNLVAIKPDAEPGEGPIGVTVEPGDWKAVADFVERWNGKRNLYFSVNEPNAGAPDGKLKKSHIAHIRAIYADVDPHGDDLEAARAAIVERARKALSTLTPSHVIDSGGGYQFYWRLSNKLDAETYGRQAEAQARGIAKLMDGDGVGNIDRIMRLPGTLNLPDAKKRARGRVERPAALLDARADTFTLDELARAYKPLDREDDEDNNEEIAAAQHALDMGFVKGHASYAGLPADLRARFEAFRQQNEFADDLWRGRVAPVDATSSGWRFELAGLLKRDGRFSADEFGALIWVWDKADPKKITARSIARDWTRSEDAPEPSQFLTDAGALPSLAQTDPFAAAAEKEAGDIAGRAARFTFETFADVANAELTTNPALIKGLLDQAAMSVLYGDSNAGKTFIALDIAAHIGAGENYAGLRTTRGLVVYVAAEGGRGIRKRFKALREKFGDRDIDIVLLSCPVDLRRPDTDLEPLVAAIKTLGRPVALVVLDTLSRVMAGGDENSSVDMGALVRHFDLLRAGCAPAHLMIVHHTGKDRARGARGHSLLRAATDTEIEVADRAVTVTKQRDMDGSWARGFALDAIALGLDNDGDPVSSCVVRLLAEGERATVMTPDVANRVLDAMAAAWDAGEPWSMAPQTRERFAVRRMVADWGFDAKEAEGALRVWASSGLVETRIMDGHSKIKGLFVGGNRGQAVLREDIFG